MHSSRMRTAHSSRHGGGLASSPSTSPLGVGLDHIPLNFPLGCGPGDCQRSGTPWDQYPWDKHPPGPGNPPRTRHPPQTRHPWDQAPPPLWTETLTHATQNITLPQTLLAGGKNSCLLPTAREDNVFRDVSHYVHNGGGDSLWKKTPEGDPHPPKRNMGPDRK